MPRFEENQIHIYNSLTRKKEPFKPLKSPNVGLYVCGPTVYNEVHLGNCRTFISFDLVNRYLRHLGYKVRYVRNITDAGHLENDADEGEDKVSQRARLEQLEPMEIVQKYTLGFHHIMEKFNALPPDIEPTATGHIVEQINAVQKIVEAGLAYEVNGSVYFDVEKYHLKNEYGKLSGRKIEELQSGSRALDGQSEKRSPLDFALWKKAAPSHIMRWNSPWSDGFPGWHLECSVMSTKYLGKEFDIHGGGMDLKFPHHECEIAQNKAAHNHDGVRYWMHGNMLTLNGARMSKSTGNTLMPEELFTGNTDKLQKGFSPSVVRFFMMQAHYGSELDFSNEALEAAEKGYLKLMNSLDRLEALEPGSVSANFDVQQWKEQCYAAMNDDFNSPVLIAHLFEAARFINGLNGKSSGLAQEQLNLLRETMHSFLFEVLGLQKPPETQQGGEKLEKVMEVLIHLRNQARADRNFELADAIRDKLAEAGVELKDGKEGTSFKVKQ